MELDLTGPLGEQTRGLQVEFQFGDKVITVNVASAADLLAQVRARFAVGGGFALATLNLDHLVKLSGSDAFRAAYGAQDLVVADGNPIVWLSRLAGRPVELVPGSDLVLPLVRLAAETGQKVALVGSTALVLEAAARHLRSEVPGLDVALCIAPPFGFDPTGPEADRIMARISSAGIGLCLLALGAPKQEVFAARGRLLAPKTGFASIGAGLDFLAGHQRRAPLWMRRLVLEWLWRLLSNPRRLAWRYSQCVLILPGQVGKALVQRRKLA